MAVLRHIDLQFQESYDQWKDRADIEPLSGDLTLASLTMNDTGTYSCWYDTISLRPQDKGSSYVLQVTPSK